MRGPVTDTGGGGKKMERGIIGAMRTAFEQSADRIATVEESALVLKNEIEKLRGQNRQLMLERNYVISIIADVRKAGKTWMCQYCAHCKGIVSGMADCDSKKLCAMPYSQFELKRSEQPEVEL
jgi:hypothetical protein